MDRDKRNRVRAERYRDLSEKSAEKARNAYERSTKPEVRKESGCENCFFYEFMENCREVKRFAGNCEAKKREDKTEVSFVEID